MSRCTPASVEMGPHYPVLFISSLTFMKGEPLSYLRAQPAAAGLLPGQKYIQRLFSREPTLLASLTRLFLNMKLEFAGGRRGSGCCMKVAGERRLVSWWGPPWATPGTAVSLRDPWLTDEWGAAVNSGGLPLGAHLNLGRGQVQRPLVSNRRQTQQAELPTSVARLDHTFSCFFPSPQNWRVLFFFSFLFCSEPLGNSPRGAIFRANHNSETS